MVGINLFDVELKIDDDLHIDEVTSRNTQVPIKRSAEDTMRGTMNIQQLKIQKKYDNWENFMKFHEHSKIDNLNEEMFLQYFDYLIETKSKRQEKLSAGEEYFQFCS